MTTVCNAHQELKSDEQKYQVTSQRFEKLADRKLANSNTLIVSGFGSTLSICIDALHVYPGKTYLNQKQKTVTIYRGIHAITHIIILSEHASISVDAISFCRDEKINLSIIDHSGNLLLALTPDVESNIKLHLAQYRVFSDDRSRGTIAFEIVKRKLEEQLYTLKLHSDLDLSQRAIKTFESTLQWFSMENLPNRYYDTNFLMLNEAKLAVNYWSVFAGVPIKWSRSDSKTIPTHYKVIGERTSLVSKSDNARYSSSIFHSALNYLYAITERQCLEAINKVGLDATISYLHSPHDNRNALCWDLMELYRARIDHLIFQFFTKLTFDKSMLMKTTTGEIRFNPNVLRYLAAECKLEQSGIDAGALWLKELLTC